MSKIIWINARSFSLWYGFWVSEYVKNLFINILKKDRENIYIFFSNEDFESDFLEVYPNFKKVIYKSNKIFFDLYIFWYLLQKYKVEIWFSPQTTVWYINRKIKVISIVHDLWYLYNYYWFFDNIYWKINFFFSFKRATKIISISDFTKSEIIKFYKIKPEKISTIYHWKNEIFFNYVSNKTKWDYILSIWSYFKRKNITFLIESFKLLENDYPNLKLYIITNNINLTKKVFKINNIPNNVFFLDWVNRKELSTLYHNSLFTVLPSIYEWFWFPLIESQMSKTLVLCSDNTSYKEIWWNSVFTFNPFNNNDLLEKMKFLLTIDNKKRENYIKLWIDNIQKYNWELSANEYINLFNNI